MALTNRTSRIIDDAHRGSVFFPNPSADVDITLLRASLDGARPTTSAKPHEAGPQPPL